MWNNILVIIAKMPKTKIYQRKSKHVHVTPLRRDPKPRMWASIMGGEGEGGCWRGRYKKSKEELQKDRVLTAFIGFIEIDRRLFSPSN